MPTKKDDKKKKIKFKVVPRKKKEEMKEEKKEEKPKPKKKIKFKVVPKKTEEKPKPKKKIKFKVVPKKEKLQENPQRTQKTQAKIDFYKVEESNPFLSGNKFIFDYEDFMTDRELQAQTESAQMRAMERSSGIVSRYIAKSLKKVAKQKKIKTTDDFIKFLDNVKTGTEMRNLLENAYSKSF